MKEIQKLFKSGDLLIKWYIAKDIFWNIISIGLSIFLIKLIIELCNTIGIFANKWM